jgi:hypothetical protein
VPGKIKIGSGPKITIINNHAMPFPEGNHDTCFTLSVNSIWEGIGFEKNKEISGEGDMAPATLRQLFLVYLVLSTKVGRGACFGAFPQWASIGVIQVRQVSG